MDTSIEFASNRQNFTLYALGPNQADLSVADKALLQVFMALPENNILNATPAVGDVTRTSLVINATLHYDTALTTESVLLAAARAAIYSWIDDSHFLGYSVYQDDIQEALKVSGVRRVVFTAPPNAVYAGANDTLYAFTKEDSATGVQIAVTPI